MRAADVDFWATSGAGFLHRTTATAKLAAFVLVVLAAVATREPAVLVLLACAVLSAALAGRLPLRVLTALSLYPVFLSLIFAVAQVGGGILGAVSLMLRAGTAGLAAVTLMLSTPYPEVFGVSQRFLPGIVGDALFMTYRSLFVLFDKLGRLLTAMRLRSGLQAKAPLQMIRGGGVALASLVLYTMDYSQRSYEVMQIRGYSGKLAVPAAKKPWSGRDFVAIGGAAALLLSAVLARAFPKAVTGLTWAFLLAGSVLILIGVVYRWARK